MRHRRPWERTNSSQLFVFLKSIFHFLKLHVSLSMCFVVYNLGRSDGLTEDRSRSALVNLLSQHPQRSCLQETVTNYSPETQTV